VRVPRQEKVGTVSAGKKRKQLLQENRVKREKRRLDRKGVRKKGLNQISREAFYPAKGKTPIGIIPMAWGKKEGKKKKKREIED